MLKKIVWELGQEISPVVAALPIFVLMDFCLQMKETRNNFPAFYCWSHILGSEWERL